MARHGGWWARAEYTCGCLWTFLEARMSGCSLSLQERLYVLHGRSTEQIAVLLPHYRKEVGRQIEEVARRALVVLKTACSGPLINFHAAVAPNIKSVTGLITQLDAIQVTVPVLQVVVSSGNGGICI